MDQNNQLVEVINQSGLDTSKSDTLMKSFIGFFAEAKEVVENCKDIEVTDESQKDLIQTARENRLKLKNIRVECENTRKQLKEQSLREGKAIDGIANVIKALIIPVEEHLEKQEKFAEIKEQLRLEKQYSERVEKLSKYVTDVSLYSLKDMADEVFENLLAGCKANFEKAQKDQRLAEKKQKEDELKQEKWHKRQIELAPLSGYIKVEVTSDTSDEEYNKIIELAKKDKKAYEDNQEKIRKENEDLQKKLDAEKKAKDDAEKKLLEEKEAQAKKEADEKDKIEADKKAQEELDRQKLLAPDKDKLLELADNLDTLIFPAVQSRNAQIVIEQTQVKLQEIISYIREKSKTL